MSTIFTKVWFVNTVEEGMDGGRKEREGKQETKERKAEKKKVETHIVFMNPF